jgi:ribonuclease-3
VAALAEPAIRGAARRPTAGGPVTESHAAAEALGRALGHAFQDPARLAEALTHASWAYEHPPAPHNARLAFLGDAVLALVVAEHLWRAEPAAPVGVLTPGRAELVSTRNLARWAEGVGLGRWLQLGRGETMMGGHAKESVLATAVEAVLGVVYLEGGLDAARGAVGRLAVW